MHSPPAEPEGEPISKWSQVPKLWGCPDADCHHGDDAAAIEREWEIGGGRARGQEGIEELEALLDAGDIPKECQYREWAIEMGKGNFRPF